MVQYYTIAGQKLGSHVLAMITLATLGGGVALSMGGSKVQKAQGPPLNAQSPDEESFIKDFLKQADAEQKKESPVVQPKH